MRWVAYRPRSGQGESAGLVVGRDIHGLRPGRTLVELLGDDGERLAAAAEEASRDPSEVLGLADAQLLSPVGRPPSVRDFASFESHIRAGLQALGGELHADWYDYPMFYFSNPACVVGSGDEIPACPGSVRLDYELEVAAIVGRAGSNLAPEQAEEHIAGYCIMNDWSARDIQIREKASTVGPAKTKDWATSLGPMLVTRDELEPFRKGTAYHLEMKASVNGKQYSRGFLDDLYWSFPEMVAYASRGTTLLPGDVIGSGTVGTGCILELAQSSDQYPWLVPGDEVTMEVAQLGRLSNRLVVGAPARPLRVGGKV
jgi:2-keto-4-pentenoate hydratase/2-oxohepta-3-ene-1,7-dioic acid hydratase in catechol pathway